MGFRWKYLVMKDGRGKIGGAVVLCQGIVSEPMRADSLRAQQMRRARNGRGHAGRRCEISLQRDRERLAKWMLDNAPRIV